MITKLIDVSTMSVVNQKKKKKSTMSVTKQYHRVLPCVKGILIGNRNYLIEKYG